MAVVAAAATGGEAPGGASPVPRNPCPGDGPARRAVGNGRRTDRGDRWPVHSPAQPGRSPQVRPSRSWTCSRTGRAVIHPARTTGKPARS